MEELGYSIRIVVKIFNRDKISEPLFGVELELDNSKLKGNEIRYLLNRRVTPINRNKPEKCEKSQEFGYTP